MAAGAKKGVHPAFAPNAMDGYALERWSLKEGLIGADTLFALGFTSYQAFLNYVAEHSGQPIDATREILVRLYMVEPEFPRMFVPPPIQDMLDFVFNLNEADGTATEEDRKRCIALLAPMLGRNRGSGYRWLRNKTNSDNPVSLPIRKLSAKIFSMRPDHARDCFWRAALASAAARGVSADSVLARLTKNGVKIG